MIEVGSLAAVERTLRAHGFFGGGADGVVADVYLGYGLLHYADFYALQPGEGDGALPVALA